MTARRRRRGATLTEMMLAAAILGVVCISFAYFLRNATKAAVQGTEQAQGQEAVRLALSRVELELSHATEVTSAGTTMVEYVLNADRSPFWAPAADPDGDGLPNERDADTDGDAQDIQPSSAAWRSGFNLADDDEDGDGQIDVRQRLYLSGRALWLDTSLNGAAWGGRAVKVLPDVSTFTITYWGSKQNALGRNSDANNDGDVSAAEMDSVLPPTAAGNNNGTLDLQAERDYITHLRLKVGVDGGGPRTLFEVETDVYPPLLPLKPGQ